MKTVHQALYLQQKLVEMKQMMMVMEIIEKKDEEECITSNRNMWK